MENYHVCLSSHDEVMFRSEADFTFAFNCFAVAALESESGALCDAFLSTHMHLGIRSSNPRYLMYRSRNAYSRYFNTKYHRKGRLGEKEFFLTELHGTRHNTAAFSYILRQGLHHGLTATPFGYRHCSINSIFRQDTGKDSAQNLIADQLRHRHLPSHIKLPCNYRMSESGLLLREDIIDTSYMENLFISPRNFLYQMNRKSGEEWRREQKEEESSTQVITLELIEKGVPDADIKKMYGNESGKNAAFWIDDTVLCEIIDNRYVPRYTKSKDGTIYDLSDSQRADIGNRLLTDIRNDNYSRKAGETSRYVTVEQIRRCAVIR